MDEQPSKLGLIKSLRKKSSRFLRGKFKEDDEIPAVPPLPTFLQGYRDKTKDPLSPKEQDFLANGGQPPPLFPEIPLERSMGSSGSIGGPAWGIPVRWTTANQEPVAIPKPQFSPAQEPLPAPMNPSTAGRATCKDWSRTYLANKNAPTLRRTPAQPTYPPPPVPDNDRSSPLAATQPVEQDVQSPFEIPGYREQLMKPAKRLPKTRTIFDLVSDSDDSDDESVTSRVTSPVARIRRAGISGADVQIRAASSPYEHPAIDRQRASDDAHSRHNKQQVSSYDTLEKFRL
jgi:hypothetical protein